MAAPAVNEIREFLFEELCDEATTLTRYWALWQQLYSNQQYVDLMRETAIHFFGMHQQLLREAILLRIHRLLDNAGSHDDQTASLETLLQMLLERDAAPLGRRLKKQLKTLRKQCADVKDWRHRQIAHLDLRTVFMRGAPLKPVQVQTVAEAVRGINAFLTEFGSHFGYAVRVAVGDLDGDTLMFLLKAGHAANPPFIPT